MLLYLGSGQGLRLRRLFFSICVRGINRAALATFRTQIEEGKLKKMRKIKQPIRKTRCESELFQNAKRTIVTHLEQPEIRFGTIRNLNTFLSFSIRT
jgi:hypothetical protein